MDSVSAYEGHADEFLEARDPSTIGAGVVADWAKALPAGCEVLEIACGGGLPVTQALIDAGLKVWAVDASSSLLRVFQSRFPNVPVRNARAQESDFFTRRFDAAVSIGLVFLLRETDQRALFHRIAAHLNPGSRFLFTAPVETGEWDDITTGHRCWSPGVDWYQAVLNATGFRLIAQYSDEGGNNHYDVELQG